MSAHEVIVIDYDVGNLLSVQRGLENCGAHVVLTADPAKIILAKRVVLPGVGAFANAMQALESKGLISVIHELARREVPLLGICLGMQLLFDSSDEFGVTSGLGLIPGKVAAIPDNTISGQSQKIPHIGWSEIVPANSSEVWKHSLLADNTPGDSAYFVHSFMAAPLDPEDRLADCFYGGHKIAAVVAHKKIFGCQFHPEKSGEVGLKILRRFCVD